MKERMKKVLALVLGTSMVLGASMTAMAAPGDEGGSASVEAPIYSFDVLDVVVPASLSMALNPDGYAVTTGASTTSTDQVVSLNYGMINLSTKDKVVEIDVKATDLNDKITFADSSTFTDAEEGSYTMFLQAVPGAVTGDSDGTALADDTAAAKLVGVTMTPDASKAVALKGGEGTVGFKLEKATYALKSGSTLDMGTSAVAGDTSNLADDFEITALGTGGTAGFTIGGAMDTAATWSDLTENVKVDVTYTFVDVPASLASASYGIVEVVRGPSITATTAGLITMANLTATQNFTGVMMTLDGSTFDVASMGTWNTDSWTSETGGTMKLQLGADVVTGCAGKTVVFTLALSDSTTKTVTVTFPAA